MWGPNISSGPLSSVSAPYLRVIPPPMVVMTIARIVSWCSETMPRPLRWWSVLSSMNILTSFRTYVGITMSWIRWGIPITLRRLKLGEWNLSIVFVGMI